ncbi:TPA: V-type ATP synthase subunit I [Candidatus Woesearchaeota archaeon]|nr:V-type ATP synthase subunit I [Candidatus Woesearchaeota archaeon]
MFTPKKMEKLLILGEKSLLSTTINTLHKQKVLHIIEHKKNQDVDIGQPLENASKTSELLLKIRSLFSYLNINSLLIQEQLQLNEHKNTNKKNKQKQQIKQQKPSLKQLEKDLTTITSSVNALLESQKQLDAKIRSSDEQLKQLTILKALKLEFDILSNYDSIAYFIGFVQPLDLLNSSLHSQKINHELRHSEVSGKQAIALFVEKSSIQKTQELLAKVHFTALDLSKFQTPQNQEKTISNIKVQALIASSQVEKQTAENKLASSKISFEKLKRQWQIYLVENELFLSAEISKAEAPLKFGATDDTFLATGYVPRDRVAQLTELLQKKTDNKLFIQEQHIHHDEHIPVQLQNKKTVRPFQFFLDLYSLPNYHEVDPSFFLFLGFPFLFGFMLGDFGYGLVTLSLFYFLKLRMQGKIAQQLFKILIIASFWSLAFGLFFGEFFGYEEIAGFHIPHVIGREHDKMLLLGAAVVVGIVHVNLGLLIGFYNELQHHGLWHAFCAKISWILLQLGCLLLYLSYGMYLIPPIFGFVLLGISVILLYIGEGIRGLVELPSIFGNILSYARLMALGLASVGLAVVVNDMAAEFFHEPSILNIIVGIFILVIGHVINIALGILGPFLHSLRLQYVEFFTKFYSGGGIAYKPFGAEKE